VLLLTAISSSNLSLLQFINMSLGLYPIIKKLGKGGFGTTYLATNTLMPSQPYCVVKQLLPTSTDPQIQQLIKDRFKQEAITLESLGKDSNGKVPSLYAYFVEQGEFYLIQEYVDGQTLSERVQAQGIFTENQVRQLLTDLLPTLAYVHQRGIVHRDIKPDNIMLCHRNNTPILIDFGAVKETMSTMMTASGNMGQSIVIGTPGFMPIEQMSGRPMFASDIYALGLTVIYLLTGKLPTEIETDPYSGSIKWQSLGLNVSSQLIEVIDKSIQPLSRDRYKNAQEMLQDLSTSSQTVTPSVIVSPLPSGYEKTVRIPTPAIVANSADSSNRLNPLIAALIGVIVGAGLIGSSLVLGQNFSNKESDQNKNNSQKAVTNNNNPVASNSKLPTSTPQIVQSSPSPVAKSKISLSTCNFFVGAAVEGQAVNVDLCSVSTNSSGAVSFVYYLGSQRMPSETVCNSGAWTTLRDREVHRPMSVATQKMLDQVCARKKANVITPEGDSIRVETE
jgi:serine/threonine protein kinase, bacterial